jgi:hypothetical protein
MTAAMHLVRIVEDDESLQSVLRTPFEANGYRLEGGCGPDHGGRGPLSGPESLSTTSRCGGITIERALDSSSRARLRKIPKPTA